MVRIFHLEPMQRKIIFFFTSESDYVAHFERDDELELIQDREKLSLFWFLGSRIRYRSKFLDTTNRVLKKVLAIFELFVQKVQHSLCLYRRINERVWGGENWVNLTGKTMDEFLEFIDANPRWLSKFRCTKSAD